MKTNQHEHAEAVAKAAQKVSQILDRMRETDHDQNVDAGNIIYAHEELKLALKRYYTPPFVVSNGKIKVDGKVLKRGSDMMGGVK